MTQRFFYTDAISAAYMARHFGMKYVSVHEQNWSHPKNFLASSNPSEEWATHQWTIHPASIPLLELQVRDVVKRFNDPNPQMIYDIVNDGDEIQIHWSDRAYNWPSEIERIVERNGTPFLFPESEAA